MSRQFAVLTAVGKDRPGLVEVISRYILQCGCNMADSRMAILGGEFAMLILVEGDQDAVHKLVTNAGEGVHKAGLTMQAHLTSSPGEGAKAGTIPYQLDAYSLDHPGIVQRISQFLADRQINIRAMDTRLSHAPHSGQPLFSLHAVLEVPTKENLNELRRGLEAIGGEENIDIEVKPATT